MVVELSTNDVTRISMGEEVRIMGVTVRLSLSLTESEVNSSDAVTRPRANGEEKPRDPIFRMFAKYDGRCYGCKDFIKKGGPIIRDTVQKRTLCMACGEPVLANFEAGNATAV